MKKCQKWFRFNSFVNMGKNHLLKSCTTRITEISLYLYT